MALVFRCMVRNGLRRVQIADPMNAAADLAQMARLAKAEGVEEVVIGLTYSVSPVHTDAFYAERARGHGRVPRRRPPVPQGPGRARRRRAPARARAAVPRRLRPAAGRAAQPRHDRAGAADVHGGRAARRSARSTPRSRRSRNGTSNPAAETTLRNLEATGLAHALDVEALAAVSRHFRALALDKRLPLGAPAEFDAAYYRHQMPGGMVTTMRRQLAEMRRPELFEAALEECGRVRAEFGWPIMVTPFSQFVGTQAVMNVMDGERYADDPRRRHRLLPRPLRRRRPRRPTRRSPTASCRCRTRRSCGRSSRSRSTARASASARGSPTRSCCCA